MKKSLQLKAGPNQLPVALVVSVLFVFAPPVLYANDPGTAYQTELFSDTAMKEILASVDARSEVTSVAYSPDGKRIVSISRDKAARIWDANTGELVRFLLGARGNLFLSCDLDGKNRRCRRNDDGTLLVSIDKNKMRSSICPLRPSTEICEDKVTDFYQPALRQTLNIDP